MNRVIKFRFWEESSSTMIFDINKLSKNPSVMIGEIFENKDIIHAMQWTGLLDSEGNQVFEGDVIHQQNKEGWHSEVDEMFVIEFGVQDLGHSSYQQTIGFNATKLSSYGNDRSLRKGILDLCFNHQGITAKVIGNIYENQSILS